MEGIKHDQFHGKEIMKDVVIYLNDGSMKEIKGVENVTWSANNIYIDVKQYWNELEAYGEPYIFALDEVSQILINFS